MKFNNEIIPKPMERTYSLDQVKQIASDIIRETPGKILLFHGPMGSGKTTLIKEVVKQLGAIDEASSPTFSLVNEYHTANRGKIYHFDFYRIEDESEALDMGVEEYFYSGDWCLIEWPEKVENLLPLESVLIRLSINDNDSRNLQMITND